LEPRKHKTHLSTRKFAHLAWSSVKCDEFWPVRSLEFFSPVETVSKWLTQRMLISLKFFCLYKPKLEKAYESDSSHFQLVASRSLIHGCTMLYEVVINAHAGSVQHKWQEQTMQGFGWRAWISFSFRNLKANNIWQQPGALVFYQVSQQLVKYWWG
jgi:hypothetical protein